MREFLRRRAEAAEDNAGFSPADALRLALGDLSEGVIGASGVAIYFVERSEDGARTYHAYRGSLSLDEEILLLDTERDRAMAKWRGDRDR